MSASSGSGSCGTHGRRSLGAARLGFDVSLWDRRRSTVHSTGAVGIPRRTASGPRLSTVRVMERSFTRLTTTPECRPG